MLRWEFINLYELDDGSYSLRVELDSVTWVRWYSRYLVAMCQIHPQCNTGLIKHQAKIMSMANDVKDKAWIEHDVHFRQQMAQMGKADWVRRYCV